MTAHSNQYFFVF